MTTAHSRPPTVLLLCLSIVLGCRGPQNLSTFEVQPTPEHLRAIAWTLLATDGVADGRRPESADGKSFLFYYDRREDMVWFRLELHQPLDSGHPAVSVAIDSDADQATGIRWYGSNVEFTLDRMVSVGPLEGVGDSVRGFNGVTDSAGVANGDWINVSSGSVTLYLDPGAGAFVFGLRREDVAPGLNRFNAIGSVGSDARWNDDIGESGFATIVLDTLSLPESLGHQD